MKYFVTMIMIPFVVLFSFASATRSTIGGRSI